MSGLCYSETCETCGDCAFCCTNPLVCPHYYENWGVESNLDTLKNDWHDVMGAESRDMIDWDDLYRLAHAIPPLIEAVEASEREGIELSLDEINAIVEDLTIPPREREGAQRAYDAVYQLLEETGVND